MGQAPLHASIGMRLHADSSSHDVVHAGPLHSVSRQLPPAHALTRAHPLLCPCTPQVEAFAFYRTIAPLVAAANKTAGEALDFWMFPGGLSLIHISEPTRQP